MEEDNQEELTAEEIAILKQLQLANPQAEEKLGVFQTFNKIIETKDTSKVGNLRDEELSAVRVLKSTALFCDEMGLDEVSTYLQKEAEIILGTSLSLKGFLIEKIVTQKKEMSARVLKGGKSKGWKFGKKNQEE